MQAHEIKFINRTTELKALKEWCQKQRPTPLYIYGPEGCGKTRLLKEFLEKFNEYFGEDAIAIYIDALERDSIEKAILTSKSIELAKNILEKHIEKFSGIGIGPILANSIATILEKAITKRKLKDNYIVIIVDDVAKAIGLEQIEWYVKWLHELLWKIRQEYKPKAINIIVTTSEGTSLKLISKHRHAHITLLWNLNKEAFKQLYHQLNPPNNTDYEQIWQHLGGNPGRLIQLAEEYEWNLQKWLKDLQNRLKPLIHEIMTRNLTQELKLLIQNSDNIWHHPTTKMSTLYDLLVENNLLMYKGFTTLGDINIPKDLDLGIGEDYAWQIPAYKKAIEEIIR